MKELSFLEEKLLEEVIRPSIEVTAKDIFRGRPTISETLNFVDLLQNVKKFYEKYEGPNWNEVIANI